MSISVRLLYNLFPHLLDRLDDRVADALVRTALSIESDVKDGMAAPHSGRIYGNHQASAPGEMPAIDLTNLINSITVDDSDRRRLQIYVYTNVEYAPMLEYGAPGANLAPRPFFTPAAEANRRNLQNALAQIMSGLA